MECSRTCSTVIPITLSGSIMYMNKFLHFSCLKIVAKLKIN